MKKILLIILIFYSSVSYGQWNIWNGGSHTGTSTTDTVYKYDALSLAYFARMTVQPPDSVKQRLDFIIHYLSVTKCSAFNDINSYTDTTLYQRYDHLYFTCLNDSANSKLDVKGTKNLINKGITWTQWKGWTGSGTTAYLNTGYNPAIDGVNWVLNSACMQVYISTITTAGTTHRVTRDAAFGVGITTITLHQGTSYGTYLNGQYNSGTTNVTDYTHAMWTLTRNDPTLKFYQTNVQINSNMYDASNGVPNGELYIAYDCDPTIPYVGFGGNFTIRDIANVNAVIIPFLVWIGAN